MPTYQLYGLRLALNRAVAGLVPIAADVKPDLVFDLSGARSPDIPPAGPLWTLRFARETHVLWPLEARTFARAGETFWDLRFRLETGFAEFVLNQPSTRVWWIENEAVSFEGAVSFLLGHIMGCVLRLRGITCLHGCVMGKGKYAMAVSGPPGRGKSTIAAVLTDQGYHVLSDDLAVLDERAGCFWVQPGYSRLRLRPAAVEALYGATEQFSPVGAFSDKRYLDLSPDPNATRRRFQNEPAPLLALYVLGLRNPNRTATEFDTPSPRHAMEYLTMNNYVDHMLTPATRAQEFERLARLVCHVPIKRILRPDGLEHLDALIKLIRGDFERADLTASGHCRE